LTSLVLTLTETLRYRGALGQWSWVLHRVTGLGVVLFLTLHVIDTSWAYFYPDLYVKAIAIYQTPLFTIGEFALVASVVYHALNGLRIAIIDFKPVWWKYQQRAAVYVLIATAVILVPVFVLMFNHVLHFYEGSPQILGLGAVIEGQLPFVVGISAAIVAALVLGFISNLIAPERTATEKKLGQKAKGSQVERFWWSFMRISGILILPLVFGHLAMMHVIQGVFDITVQNFPVVGTTELNVSGTAVEFVADRWNTFIGPLAIWRVYDFALLILVTVHGFNGLRLVLTDYTTFSPVLKRASVYLCVIGAIALLITGVGALFGTIDQTAIDMATQAMQGLHE
jgi:succinate dehydrogenase / fumarate reductase, cytochrome b subunit